MKFEQLTRFARGFVYAYNGIRAAVQEERNFRFHLCAAFYACLLYTSYKVHRAAEN